MVKVSLIDAYRLKQRVKHKLSRGIVTMINISAIVSPVHVVLGRSMIAKPSLYEHNLTCFFFKRWISISFHECGKNN